MGRICCRAIIPKRIRKYSYDDGKITIQDGLAYIYDGTALINGSIIGDTLNMDVTLTDIDVGELLPDKDSTGKPH